MIRRVIDYLNSPKPKAQDRAQQLLNLLTAKQYRSRLPRPTPRYRQAVIFPRNVADSRQSASRPHCPDDPAARYTRHRPVAPGSRGAACRNVRPPKRAAGRIRRPARRASSLIGGRFPGGTGRLAHGASPGRALPTKGLRCAKHSAAWRKRWREAPGKEPPAAIPAPASLGGSAGESHALGATGRRPPRRPANAPGAGQSVRRPGPRPPRCGRPPAPDAGGRPVGSGRHTPGAHAVGLTA